MRATVMYKAGDVRIERVPDPKILEPTDAILRITRACICGSDLWPYKLLKPVDSGQRMGHEAIGIVEEVGAEVRTLKTGDFVIMPFAVSDGTCARYRPRRRPHRTCRRSSLRSDSCAAAALLPEHHHRRRPGTGAGLHQRAAPGRSRRSDPARACVRSHRGTGRGSDWLSGNGPARGPQSHGAPVSGQPITVQRDGGSNQARRA